ncbi:MAG: DUF1003 domain-containing protein [Candidatus Saccharimonadales bacterium]
MTFNWHTKHKDESSIGERMADSVASGMGSWRFIIIQTIVVIIWMVLNTVGFINHWDIYPFILLNLVFSTQAAYAAPIIMMAQNRAADRDRVQAQNDYETNMEAEHRIELLQQQISHFKHDTHTMRILELEDKLAKLEKYHTSKLDTIIELLAK